MSMGSSLKIIFDHFFLRLVFSGYCFNVFLVFFEIFISFRIFILFYTKHEIIRGRRHWVLTDESPRLTMMDDNNTLTVFAGYCTRSLFPVPAFLNDVHVAGIHPGLIKLNEIKTPVLEFFLTGIERNSLSYNIFVSSQELSCRHKPISNSKLTDQSASPGRPGNHRHPTRVELRVFRADNCFLTM